VDAQNQPKKTTATAAIARKAFDQANALRSEFYIRVKIVSVDQLKTFYYPPVFDEQSIVLPLPDVWQFKTDPTTKACPRSGSQASRIRVGSPSASAKTGPPRNPARLSRRRLVSHELHNACGRVVG